MHAVHEGTLASSAGAAHPTLCSLAFAAPLGALAMGPAVGSGAATRVNGALTLVMLGAFGALLCAATASLPWGAVAAAIASGASGPCWAAALSSPPLIGLSLQLLTFGEAVPSVCLHLRGHLPSIQRAIWAGSTLPLAMCLTWNLAANAILTAGPAQQGPVDVLAALGGSAIGPHVTVLAWSACATTTIGCCMALFQFFCDVFRIELAAGEEGPGGGGGGPGRRRGGRRRWWTAALLTLGLPLGIASAGPHVYYAATTFAGEYPAVALWGLAPPLMAWASIKGKQGVVRPLQGAGLLGLLLLSLGFLAATALHDLRAAGFVRV